MIDLHRRPVTRKRRGSIEIRTPAAFSTPVNSSLVNWLPWSVLKISGRPQRDRASSSASTRKSGYIVLLNRHVRTARVAQSMIAIR